MFISYETRLQDPADSNDKAIVQKYKFFIKYLKDTWLERCKDGMINYVQERRQEWTNKSIESYHCRLQNQLTKNPSLQQFIFELQKEEKHFSEKYFECLKYGGLFHKKENQKRKIDKKSQTPLKIFVKLTSEELVTTNPSSNSLKKK